MVRPAQLDHAVEDGVARLGVDAHGGLVEEDEGRVVDQRRRQVEASLHATGELPRSVAPPVGQGREGERPLDPVGEDRPGQPLYATEEPQILLGSQRLVEGDRLGRHPEQPTDLRVAGRALPVDVHRSPIRVEEPQDLPPPDLEREAIDRDALAEPLVKISKREHPGILRTCTGPGQRHRGSIVSFR